MENQSHQKTDALVVGSGPTGLMAALLLQRCGIKFRIVDKSEQQAHESRAFALHARSMELLQSIGIAEEFLKRGVITPGVQIFVNSRKTAEMAIDDIGTSDTPYSFILMLPQSEIENILITELEKQGVTVEHNTKVSTFTQHDDVVSVTVDKQGQTEIIQATYLIGADGAHSIVRNTLGLSFEGAAYSQTFMLADCDIDWSLDYAYGKMFLRGQSLGVYLPIKGKTLGRIITIDPRSSNPNNTAGEKSTTAEPLTLGEIEKSFQDAAGLPVRLSNPIWTARYRIHHRGVDQYKKGNVFVAGDAAHIHSPAGGQGMNTGLQDVANLIWKLAIVIKNNHPKKLLDTYQAERWPVGQKLLKFTDKLFGKITTQHRWQAVIRNFLIPPFMKLLTKNQCLRKRAFRFVSELGIRYHKNDFLCDHVSKRGFTQQLSPGHRAPNAIYKRNHDIFGLIQGYQFHVLALSKKALSLEEIEKVSKALATLPQNIGLPLHTHFIAHSLTGENKRIIQAESNQIFEHYGLNNKNPFGLFLIRPDGYIAYRADTLDVENLKEFLKNFNQY